MGPLVSLVTPDTISYPPAESLTLMKGYSVNLLRSIFVNPGRSRPRAGWRIAIGFAVLMTTIGILAAAVDAIEIPFIESFLWQLLAAPILIGLAKILASRVDRRAFRDYGLVWQPGRLAIGTVLGVGLVALIFWVQLRFGWAAVGERLHNRYDVPFVVGWIGFALRYGAVAIFEELFHRGFLITNLAEGLGGAHPRRGLGCLLAALIFGALHLTNDNATAIGAVNVTLLGLLFGVVYLWTRSLSLAIGLHFGWNFALGPGFGLPVSGYEPRVSLVFSKTNGAELWTGGAFGPEGGLLATLVLVAFLTIFVAIRQVRRSERT